MHEPTLTAITRVAATEFGVTVADLRGPRQLDQLSTPRQIAWAVALATSRITTGQISAYFGGRNSRTITVGVRQVSRKIQDPSIAIKAVRVCERLHIDPAHLGLRRSVPVVARFAEPIRATATWTWGIAA
jgi:hypothetical protein